MRVRVWVRVRGALEQLLHALERLDHAQIWVLEMQGRYGET